MIAPIIGAEEIPSGAVPLDVRWTLDGGTDRAGYVAGHLPGARFVDFDQVCVGPGPPVAGRHPLPTPERFAEGLGAAGVADEATTVVYDAGPALAAARLVWMLRTIGHDAALLDGGLTAWPGPLERGDPPVAPVTRRAVPWPADAMADADTVAAVALADHHCVFDSRTLDRYRGAPHPLDTRPGHVPGAVSLPYAGNLGADGRFLDPLELRLRFRAAGADDESIYYCGSGVSACINALAAEHAGIGRGRIYVGSWSGWTADPDRAASTADDGTA